MSRLGQMMNMCTSFQLKLGNDVMSQKFINEQTLAMFVETAEMIQETNWKSWKKPKEIDQAKFREELIDMWHFMINLTLASGMDASDVYEQFMAKHRINRERQDKGY